MHIAVARNGWRRFAVLAWAALLSYGCPGPTAPTNTLQAPTLVSPLDDAIAPQPPMLIVNNVTSTGTGARTYDFQVADNQASLSGSGTSLLASATGVAEGAGQTSYRLDAALQATRRYYWRARATQGGTSGSWSSVFRFQTAGIPNNPPVIQQISLSSPRVEVNAQIQLTAVVQDQETSPASLTYEWTATAGSFSGSGASVTWRAPAAATVATHDLTLTVIERYTAIDADGRSQSRENRVSGSVTAHVNDSGAELSLLALTFLDDFVHSERSAAFCVRNFSDSCRGKQDEFNDITANRAEFVNDPGQSSFSIGSITYNTPGNVPTGAMSATVLAPCNFAARRLSTGAFGIARGTCRLTNVYENWQWRLCESNFLPASDAFSRAFIF